MRTSERGYRAMPLEVNRCSWAICPLKLRRLWRLRLCPPIRCVHLQCWWARGTRRQVRLVHVCTPWRCCRHTRLTCSKSSMRARELMRRTSKNYAKPLICLSAPQRRPPKPLGGLWQLWWRQRGISGWPCLISKTVTVSSSWTPRFHLLACAATCWCRRWRHFSGFSLAALLLREIHGRFPSGGISSHRQRSFTVQVYASI